MNLAKLRSSVDDGAMIGVHTTRSIKELGSLPRKWVLFFRAVDTRLLHQQLTIRREPIRSSNREGRNVNSLYSDFVRPEDCAPKATSRKTIAIVNWWARKVITNPS